MQTPVYAAELTRVQQETHVFKFADKLTVAFECSIKLCLKTEGQCSEITVRKLSSLLHNKHTKILAAKVR